MSCKLQYWFSVLFGGDDGGVVRTVDFGGLLAGVYEGVDGFAGEGTEAGEGESVPERSPCDSGDIGGVCAIVSAFQRKRGSIAGSAWKGAGILALASENEFEVSKLQKSISGMKRVCLRGKLTYRLQ